MRSKLKARFAIVILLGFLGVGIFCFGKTAPTAFSETGFALQLVGLGILAIALIVNLTIRCPNCGKHLTLGKRIYRVPHYCPDCGQAISDEETVE